MALPPTIPTSFVPRPAAAPSARPRPYFDFAGAFFFVSVVLFACAIAGSIAVYLYGNYLTQQKTSKDQQLIAAEAQIDQGTIASLITLQGQLTQGKQLLDQHVAVSQFLDALGTLTPRSVNYQSFSLILNTDHSAIVALSGTAATFNALAALSADLATNTAIKDAIFSGIAVGKGGVGFSLSAVVDPSLVVMPAAGFAATAAPAAASALPPAAPIGSTTPQ